MNRVSITRYTSVSLWNAVLVSFGYLAKSGRAVVVLWATSSLTCGVSVLVYILTSICKGSSFPTSLPVFVVICFLNESHFVWGEMKSQSSFNLQFLDGWGPQYFFKYLWSFVFLSSSLLLSSLLSLYIFLCFSIHERVLFSFIGLV